MQDLVNPLPFGKGATAALYKVKKIKWRLFTSFEEVTKKFHGLRPWKKEMIPKRAITVGYNGPTKGNVTPEGMLKDINQNL